MQRTAGSHSPVDVFAIDMERKYILFVQSKPDDFSEKGLMRILKEMEKLRGFYKVRFVVR